MPNYNSETGIAYGVVSLNNLEDWVFEEFFNYGENLSYTAALTDWKNENPDATDEDEQEFAESWLGEEDEYGLTTNDMKLGMSYLGGAPLVWVFESPHTTQARKCSPCIPGAGDLDNQEEDGDVTCYTLPADWFHDSEKTS